MNDGQPTFGAHVAIAATVLPCYVRATHRRETVTRIPADALGPFDRVVEVRDDGPLRHEPADHNRMWAPDDLGADGAPGEPLPDAPPLPDRPGIYRILRRFPIYPTTETVVGVIIGRTWREEGRYHAAAQNRYDGEIDLPHLVGARRVSVFQVALDPGDVGQRPWPARTVLVIPSDVEPGG